MSSANMEDPEGFSAPARYRYDKLPADGKPLRLIKLDNTADGGLEIRLISHQLSSAPSYTAISYRWGDERRSCTLSIGKAGAGAALPVTATVYEMLNALRPDPGNTNPLYLWVDFVCINQDDPFEKDQQIPLMRDIYAGACEVVCYLGQAPDAALAHEFVPLLSAFWIYITTMQGLGVSVPPDQMLVNPFIQQPDGLTAFRRLIANQYWTRAWIIQEIICGQKIRLRYGDRYMVWDNLGEVLSLFWARSAGITSLFGALAEEPSGTAILALNCINNLGVIKELLLTNGPPPLQDVLLMARHSRATEPRDKVLAILGLSRDVASPSLQPNHTLTTQQVYTNAVWHCLQQGEFALLNLAGRIHHATTNSPLSEALPSWVPDLSSDPSLLWPLDNPQAGYTAGGSPSSSSVGLSPDGAVLSARGFVAGRIAAIAPPIHKALMSMTDGQAVCNLGDDPEAFIPVHGSWLKNLWGLVKRLVPADYPPARADVSFVNLIDCSYDGDADGDRRSDRDNEAETREDTVREILAVHQDLNDSALQSRIEAFWRTLVGDEVPDDDARIGVIFPAPEHVANDFSAYTDFVFAAYAASLAPSISTPGSDGDLEQWLMGLDIHEEARRGNLRFSAFAGRKAWPRRFAVTDRGYMALMLDGVEVGDEVVVFYGARTPYVVRRVEDGTGDGDEGERYELLAEAYLHGFMQGEGVDGGFEERLFHLV
jgi:hypothetical protein